MATVVTLSLVASMATVLTACAVQFYRERQADRVAITTHTVADSAGAYVQLHRAEWNSEMSPTPIDLPVEELLSPGLSGTARLSFETVGEHYLCRITVVVRNRANRVRDQIEIRIN
jgi:hypothetical protein